MNCFYFSQRISCIHDRYLIIPLLHCFSITGVIFLHLVLAVNGRHRLSLYFTISFKLIKRHIRLTHNYPLRISCCNNSTIEFNFGYQWRVFSCQRFVLFTNILFYFPVVSLMVFNIPFPGFSVRGLISFFFIFHYSNLVTFVNFDLLFSKLILQLSISMLKFEITYLMTMSVCKYILKYVYKVPLFRSLYPFTHS